MNLGHPRSQELGAGGVMTPPGSTTNKKCGQYVCTGVFGLAVVAIWLVSGVGIPDSTHVVLWAAFAIVPLVVACGCGFRCAAEQQREAARQNQLSGVTELRQRRNSQYQDLHIDIPPPADFFVQESPPPSYEASSFTKPVVTPPPTYSAAVDLTGSPPVWNVPAAVHQTVTPQLPLDDGTASPRAHPTRAAAEEPRHHSSAGCD